MDIYLIGLRTKDGKGILTNGSGALSAADTVEEARGYIKYGLSAGDAIHWMNYCPCVIRLSADTEELAMKELVKHLKRIDEGKVTNVVFHSIAGRLTAIYLDQNSKLFETHFVCDISPISEMPPPTAPLNPPYIGDAT